ncbi:stage V sporulation protein K [Calderihabitans maritimus]|uniref:Stage V sporulation protein K n=1 Tax=Calderihabitans maritimus TaxID=1246530 RepID=A0A1Z5HPP5_9FIRM|nr:stage V sporulation protein K [Calderihabitans maritimus]GAW91484.1 stage V sporulation protein K [Calderihabitans maritimus]
MEIKLRFGTENKLERPKSNDNWGEMVEKGTISPAKAINLIRHYSKQVTHPPISQPEEAEKQKLDEILKELDDLIGLTEIKDLVKEIVAYVEIQKIRAKERLATEPTVLHMIFRGNPGTGKTTVARIIGKLFKELGVLQKGHLVEVERADLVGEYIGHTAQKTREQVKRAMGGILFIDEAYSLARGGEKDFGKETIDVLVKAMEDHKNNLILILAGYKEEMDWFLRTNPGLRSRFPIHLDFPDYTIPELMAIAHLMLERRQYKLSPEAETELEKILRKEAIFGHEHSGNARLVRNIIEKAIRRQAVRLVQEEKLTRQELMSINLEDIQGALGNG